MTRQKGFEASELGKGESTAPENALESLQVLEAGISYQYVISATTTAEDMRRDLGAIFSQDIENALNAKQLADRTITSKLEARLFFLKRKASTAAIQAAMEQDEYVPATFRELLAFVRRFPLALDEHKDIVGLAERVRMQGGFYVPVIRADDQENVQVEVVVEQPWGLELIWSPSDVRPHTFLGIKKVN